MYFRTEENENGEYLRSDGERLALYEAHRVRPSDGWTVFNSRSECLAAWELVYSPLPAAPPE